MHETFRMNGYLWEIEWVNPFNDMLIDRTNKRTVATTDPVYHKVYLSNKLEGDFLMRVFIHELGHCALISYHLLEELHDFVYPDRWIDAEEWACNLLADYGFRIFSVAFQTMGYEAWKEIPKAYESLFAA